MTPYSAKLQQVIEELLARHRASAKQTQVRLQLSNADILEIDQVADQRQMWLRHFVVVGQLPPLKDLEIVFFINDENRWIPYQYHRHPTDHWVCGSIDRRYAKLVIDNPSCQQALANQCDLWATRLRTQGWLGQATVYRPDNMTPTGEFLWPLPTVDEPDLETLEQWMVEDSGCEATDGCFVEPDGTCPHGHPSWLLKLGLI